MANDNGTVATSTPQQIANTAKALGLEADARTSNGIDLVIAGKVVLDDDGSALVSGGSASAPSLYTIKGDDCPCHDAEFNPQPDGCKHARAVLIQRALVVTSSRPISEWIPEPAPEPTCLAEVWGSPGDEPTYCDPEPVASNGALVPPPVEVAGDLALPTPHWNQTEPRFVHSIKWQERTSGIEHMTVIRSDDWSAMLAEIAAVTRIAEAHRQVPEADSPQGEALATDPSWCGTHGEHMKKSQDGGGYYHKAGEKADGKAVWCRGK